MFNLLMKITSSFGTGYSSSFLCGFSSFFTTVANFFGKVFNFIYSIMWEVMKFVFGVLEALELMISTFLGIKYNPDSNSYEAINAEEVVQFAKDRDFYNDLITVFRGLLLASIILLFIFTIYAIIKQEIANASSGFATNSKTGKPHNQVGPVVLNMFKHMLLMLTLPLIMLFLIQGVNSVLASFRNAFSEAGGSTIAGQVLASSTFDANKYRTYANANQRIPIIIEVYDADQYADDEKDKLLGEIRKVNIQKDLTNIATNLAEKKFVPFDKGVVYENNKLYNSARFDLQFETFVCTAEQYTVMADFVDYAQLNNINYYVRSMDDVNIDWGYIDSTIYSATDNSLTITYKDGSDIDGDGETNDTYELLLAPQTEVTSPVSDALDSIMALLGIGEYGDNVFKVMERDDSGEFLNLVDWKNEKCILKFSEHFEFENSNTWTDTDQIIIYEYYHYPENNTLGAYSRSDFDYEGDGVEIPVYQIAYKKYIPEIDGYSAEKYMEVINLNGNYYKVQKSNTLTDFYGNPYYELVSQNRTGAALGNDIHFLNPNYSILQKTNDFVHLACSSTNFSLVNNPNSWNLVDQVLIYEYYSDLSVNNMFGRYTFADIVANGVDVAVYNISDSKKVINEKNQVVADNGFETTPYALINGTFYELTKTGASSYKLGSSSVNIATDDYLVLTSEANKTYYKYSVLFSTADGSNGFTDSLDTPEKFIFTNSQVDAASFAALASTDPNYEKFADVVLQFSENFKYTNPDTWSYRDYFIFYLYANYKVSNGIDAIKLLGIEGDIGKVTVNGTSKYVFKTKKKVDRNSVNDHLYLDLENVVNISELNIHKTLDYTTALKENNFDNHDDNLFITFEPTTDNIKIIETTSTLFNFSTGFVPEDVTTWTMGDYVLYYMGASGLIDKYSAYADTGYQALTYEVQNNSGTKDTLFAFGRVNDNINIDAPGVTQSDINNKYSKVLYLSENRVLGLKSKGNISLGYKNLSGWLNTNLYTYLCMYNDLDADDVVTEKNEILSGLYTSFEDQILSFNTLVNEIVNDNWQGVYDNVTTFTYKNPTFKADDLTTWTNFDALLYLLKGTMSGALNTKIALGSDPSITYKYIVMNGKAINISAGLFDMNIVDEFTIDNGENKRYADYEAVATYYSNSLAKLVKSSTGMTAVNTLIYEYKPEHSFTLSTATESSFNSKDINELDIILAMNAVDKSVDKNKTYKVSLFTDGVFEYLKVGDVYVLVDEATETDRYSSFAYSMTATLSLVNTTSPFTDTGSTYTSFTTLDGANTLRITPIDAAIYAATNSLESKTYKVYKFNNKNFLHVISADGRVAFIEYKNTTNVVLEDAFALGSSDTSNANEQEYVNYVYNQYYSVLQSDMVYDLASTSDSVTYRTRFSIAAPRSWNPLDIILYQKGFINGDDEDKELLGEVKYSSDGSKTYLRISQTTTAGITSTIYINITRICDVDLADGVTSNIIHKETALNTLYLQLFGVRNDDKTFDETEVSVISSYDTLKSNITTKYNTTNTNVSTIGNVYDVTSNIAAACDVTISASFDKTNPTSWTWLDLIYYYYNFSIRTESVFWVYYSESYGSPTPQTRSFIEVSNGSKNIYLEYTNILWTSFTTNGTKVVTYDPSSFTLLSLIVNSLTNDTSSEITIYKLLLQDGGFKEFYYIEKFSNGEYYGIYELDETGGSMGFELVIKASPYTTTNDNLEEIITGEGIQTPYAKAYFTVKSYKDITSWSIADFMFAYARGSVNQDTNTNLESRIYKFATKYYFAVDDTYVNISTLEEKEFVNFAYSNGTEYYVLNETATLDIDPLINEVTYGAENLPTGQTRKNVVTSFVDLDTAEQLTVTNADRTSVFVKSTTDINTLTANIQRFAFSAKFDPSDFKTWTNADFIMYYAVMAGFYTPTTGDNFNFSIPYTYTDGSGNPQNGVRNYKYSTKNFQTFVANGGLPAFVYYLSRTDSYGNSYTTRVINFSNNVVSQSGTYVDYDIFISLYTRMLASIDAVYEVDEDGKFTYGGVDYYLSDKPGLYGEGFAGNVFTVYTSTMKTEANKANFTVTGYASTNGYKVTINTNTPSAEQNKPVKLTLSVSEPTSLGPKDFWHMTSSADQVVDLTYKNYYYYKGEVPKSIEAFNLLENVDSEIQTAILSGTSIEYVRSGYIELKLSSTFVINDPSKWTLLDYIYMYEYSKAETNLNFGYDEDDNLVINANTASNIFYGMNYQDLKNGGNYIDLYCNVNNPADKYIALNGTVYNLKNYIRQVDTTNITFLTKMLEATESYITGGHSGEYISALASALDPNDYGSGRFSRYFVSGIDGYSVTGANASEKVKNAIAYMMQLCSNFTADTGNADKADDLNLAQYLYGRLNQYGNGVVPANNTLAATMKTVLPNRIEYLEKNSEYMLRDNNIKINNCNYTIDETGDVVTTGTILTMGTDKNNNFKCLYETIEYSINRAVSITGTVGTQPNTIAYTTTIDNQPSKYKGTTTTLTLTGQGTVYRYIYENTKEIYIQSLSLLPIYEIYPLIMEVSWPQKLMEDMQVLYPDLNWSTLIATDGWLDTLGEFTSAYSSGLYVSTGNSANTTAAGLVLSEFFLSCANSVSSSYANYEYTSLFDEEVLQSLMLSIMGEEEYTTLKLQAKVFMEFFNTSFAAILDDIAFEKAVTIASGQVDNFVMSVYKSYLATALLSSDIGEYLYTVATRVYAEYTIYESLAQAAGDYNGYFAYMNKQYDTNGQVVDAFTYASFKELVLYENEISGNANPVFTFSMYKAYELYLKQKLGDDNKIQVSISGTTRQKYKKALEQHGQDKVYKALYSFVWDYYSTNYYKEKIKDTDPMYCFMFETYFEIRRYCGSDPDKYPIYLKEYESYLNGTTIRWDVVKDVSITSTTQYLPNYNKYKNARNFSKMLATITFVSLDGKTMVDNGTSEDQNAFQNFLDWLNVFDNEYSDTHYHVLKDSMTGVYDEYVDLVYPASVGDYLRIYDLMQSSEGGDAYYKSSWERLLKIQEAVPLLISEINMIMLLETDTEKTDNGSSKIEVDIVYEDMLDNLVEFQSNLDAYISAQQTLDKISKTSINFALGEYGQHYIPTGYVFTVDGKEYTFSTDISAVRLAEYVMGGSYLIDYGIEAYYTDPDYKGLIQAKKVYNAEEGYVQTSLDIWKQLRTFAGQLANYTGKLYFQSNLPDVAANKKDGVMLDSYIFADVYSSKFNTPGNLSIMKTTPEYLILKYLIQEENIDIDTFISLIFGDTVSTLASHNSDNIPSSVSLLAVYLNGGGATLSEAQKEQGVLDYLYYIQSDYYTSGYYSPTGNTPVPERIHQAFKNVMSYLLVSEEQEETVAEDPIVLDDITMIEFKQLLMEKIVDYQQNPSETAAENSNRYIALFNLISCQFKFYAADQNGSARDYVSTQVNPYDIKGVSANAATLGMLNYSNTNTYLYATYDLHKSTRDLILRLAGIENRPIEELVNLEYDNLYNRNGVYDENMGDVFIVCSLDEVSGKYVPVMARGKNVSSASHRAANSLYFQYSEKYKMNLVTEAYNNAEGNEAEPTAYPIIAKGVITADGFPTAIRMEDENLYYYRTNVIAAVDADEEALAATSTVSEVSTIGYTKYVESSAYKRVSNTVNKSTMFSSGYDLRTTIASNGTLTFMQEKVRYSTTPSDDYGGINVIDSITYYYQMGGQTYLLLLIGISTMLPMLFNASASVCRRVLDIILLSVMSPVMISMKQLDGDGSNQGMGTQAFEQWKGMMTKSLLYAFAYVVGFNIYYIVIKTTMGMTFVSDLTFERITALGGLSFITRPLLEAVLKALWVIAAASFVKGAAQLFTDILVNEDGSNPFASALGVNQQEPMDQIISTTKDVIRKVKAMVGGVKNMANSIRSGQFLNDLKNAAVQGAMQMMPGSKLIGAAVEAGHVMKDKADAKNMEKQAIAAGVDKETAKSFSKSYVEQNREGRQKERQRKVDSANRFMNTFMPGMTKGPDGKQQNVFSNITTVQDVLKTKPNGGKGYGWKPSTPQWKADRDAKKKKQGKGGKGKGKK